MLKKVPFTDDENILVGMSTLDDAGVYRMDDDRALVFSTDFFPPIVSDAEDFGRIVAANCLSDIYAMGAKPLIALSLLLFPEWKLSLDTIGAMMRGGVEGLNEAGTLILGGHSMTDDHMNFGFAIIGTVRPDKIVSNSGAKPGDALILTKPLGSGVITTALRKEGLVSDETLARITEIMAELNKIPSEVMLNHGVHAATDVTGFGFIGHLNEMLEASEVSVRLSAEKIPYLPEARELAKMGLLPAGSLKNRSYAIERVEIDPSIPEEVSDLFFDAQNSGGLIIALPKENAKAYLDELVAKDKTDAVLVGEVIEKAEKNVYLEP